MATHHRPVPSSPADMAQREGNVEVTSRLKAALEAAMAAKQQTLRPEIQLLNALLADDSAASRKLRLAASSPVLHMDGGYFFRHAG